MKDVEDMNHVENSTLIEEEKAGYANTYIVRHRTSIKDQTLLDSIKRMSILEIVS